MIKMHCLVWSVAFFCATIPLVTAKYGRQGLNSQVEWCFLREDNYGLYIMWNVVDWIAFISLVYFGMCYYSFRVFLKIYPNFIRNLCNKGRNYNTSNNNNVNVNVHTKLQSAEKTIFVSMVSFPLVLLVSWVPYCLGNSVLFYQMGTNPDRRTSYNQTVALGIIQLFPLLYGILVGILFFVRSHEVRQRWRLLLCPSWVTEEQSQYLENDFDEQQLAYHTASTRAGRMMTNGSNSQSALSSNHSSSAILTSVSGISNSDSSQKLNSIFIEMQAKNSTSNQTSNERSTRSRVPVASDSSSLVAVTSAPSNDQLNDVVNQQLSFDNRVSGDVFNAMYPAGNDDNDHTTQRSHYQFDL